MDSPRKILIIRIKSIGDVLFTLPATNMVRENEPDSHITFLVGSESAGLIKGFPAVDQIITYDRARLKKPLTALPELLRILYNIRRGKFSLVIDMQGYGETAWLSWFSGAKERWGAVYSKGRDWAYTKGVTRRDDIHPADWCQRLLEACGMKAGAVKNEFHLPAAAQDSAREWFEKHDLNPEIRTLYIQPFTSRTFKDWPLENYLTVARHWREKGVQIIFGGGPGDAAALEPARAAGFSVLAGSSMLVTGGIMQLSSLVLGGDTGMLHLAVGLGQRTIMLIGHIVSGSSDLYQHREWAVVPPEGMGMKAIAVETVIEETTAALR